MENEAALSRDITRSIRVDIVGNPDDVNGPLYAINWFDTRIAVIYHFYNLIAAPRVYKIDGKPLFKGKCKETIGGDPEMARQFLLIVNYPSGTRFLDLVSDRIFQLTSVFRIMAVKRFSFVFHKRKEIHQHPPAGQKFDASDCYAVLHFKKRDDGNNDDRLSELDGIATAHGAEIFFAGSVTGQVVLVKKSGERDPSSFITDSTVLFKTSDQQAMAKLFDSAEMKALLSAATGYFASYIKRTI